MRGKLLSPLIPSGLVNLVFLSDFIKEKLLTNEPIEGDEVFLHYLTV
jgi:hypothetical protein